MRVQYIHLHHTDSTNRYVAELSLSPDTDLLVVDADYQTAGRGQGTNTWESEEGSNLLFSVLCCPHGVQADCQYVLSMAGALALHDALSSFPDTHAYADGFSLKWPNDVYYRDYKVSGTLIQTSLHQHSVRRFIWGVGINVNQQQFRSDAPNPMSLCYIVGHELDRQQLLEHIVSCLISRFSQVEHGEHDAVSDDYHSVLYRREGWHTYRDAGGLFSARILGVRRDGALMLADTEGRTREYAFKEVEYVIQEKL